MKTIIIAPHPDDEWIGCGCTILKSIKEGKHVSVLIITKAKHSLRRLKNSIKLSKKYSFSCKCLGEPERGIKKEAFVRFIAKNVKKEDTVYIPDYDLHPDHRFINMNCRSILSNKKVYEYAVYNNSLNPLIRIKNIIHFLFKRASISSFRRGREDFKMDYKSDVKSGLIPRYFFETPRGPDVVRRLKIRK